MVRWKNINILHQNRQRKKIHVQCYEWIFNVCVIIHGYHSGGSPIIHEEKKKKKDFGKCFDNYFKDCREKPRYFPN